MKARARTVNVLVLVGFLAVTFAVAATASWFTLPSIPTWYAGLTKPAWTPPNWLFGPVWTLLYALMAVAAWQVWRVAPAGQGTVPLTWWGVQLTLNFAWSLLFFHLHRPAWALSDIAGLLVAIAGTIATFWRVDRLAALLLVPYLLWVSYATALNLAIVRLNG